MSEKFKLGIKTEQKEETEPMAVAWIKAREDANIVAQVQAYKDELADTVKKWGAVHGIADLKLQHIMTMAKDPDAKISYYWNPNKLEWFRYRQGDEVPRWLLNLTNRNDYKFPKGSELTQEILAKFKGRVGLKQKVTSLD